MQLRMLLKPTLFPFLRVRGSNTMQPRRSGPVIARSQINGRGVPAAKGRRFST